MRVTVYSTKSFERPFLAEAAASLNLEPVFVEFPLEPSTVSLARGSEAICAFVNDDLSAPVLHLLAELGVRNIALRCAGFNSVHLETARELNLSIARVPAYSPEAVAEHAFALLLTLSRKTHRAYNRVREMNFSLNGLVGFNLHGRTVGVVGCGKIGLAFCRIAAGFGMKVLAYDPFPPKDSPWEFVSLERIWAEADIISLHCPLTPDTHHLVNQATLEAMKPGVVLLNTSRGAVIDTPAAIEALQSHKIGALGLDVYEEESGLFFRDLSGSLPTDETFARLLTFPNVLITGHQAFLTTEALEAIAETTAQNLAAFRDGNPIEANRVA